MDYFIKKLDQKINLEKELENYAEVKSLLQVKMEYSLLFLLAYYKRKNFSNIELEDQEYINHILFPHTAMTTPLLMTGLIWDYSYIH